MIILIIHIIVTYDQNTSLIFLWKMDSMSGFDIRLVFTLPPRDSTLEYKRCVHLWNNFPYIISLEDITFLSAKNYFFLKTFKTPFIKIILFSKFKYVYIVHSWLYKALCTVVNPTWHSINYRSLEITSTKWMKKK